MHHTLLDITFPAHKLFRCDAAAKAWPEILSTKAQEQHCVN
jgi:hypothetical protein